MTENLNADWDVEEICRAASTFQRHNDGDSLSAPFPMEEVAGLGDLYRAWHALEEPWLNGITTDELVTVLADEIVESSHEAVSDLRPTLGAWANVGWLSEMLSILVQRQGIYQVWARDGADEKAARVRGITSLYWAINRAVVVLADPDRVQRLLRVPEGTQAKLKTAFIDRIGLDSPRSLDARDIELPQDVLSLHDELQATRLTLEELLAHGSHLFPNDPHIAHAHGTHLGLIGRYDEAMEKLAVARSHWPDDVAVNYMMVDVQASMGRTGSIGTLSMLNFTAVPDDELWIEYPPPPELEDPYLGDVGEIERLLVMRGIRVEAGLECPYTTPTADWGIGPYRKLAQTESIAASLDRLLLGQEQTRTDVGALRADLRSAWSREAFFLDQLAQLMPRKRRQVAEDVLKTAIFSFSALPRSARDRLVGAQYLMSETELSSWESVTAVVASLAACIEAVGRVVLSNDRVRFSTMPEFLERRGASARLLETFSWFRDKRNPAIHADGDVTSADVQEIWQRLLGTKKNPGLIDEMMSLKS